MKGKNDEDTAGGRTVALLRYLFGFEITDIIIVFADGIFTVCTSAKKSEQHCCVVVVAAAALLLLWLLLLLLLLLAPL